MRNPLPPWSQRALHLAVLATLSTAAWLGAQDQPQTVVVIEAGSVHPVSGPVIEDGVVLIRGDRIAAVGRKGEVEIPTTATLLSYPRGHVYPGLVDALSDAFADEGVLFANADAGTPIRDGLNRHLTTSRNLVTYGITTAYVSNRATSQWRGIGAVLRPKSDGYEIFPGHGEAAVQMRLTSGPARSHPLSRQQALDSAGNAFQALEAYQKRFSDHQKALAEYQEKYEEYLDYHRQNQATETGERGQRQGGRRGRGQGRGGRRRGQGQGNRGQRGQGDGGDDGQRRGGQRRGGQRRGGQRRGGQRRGGEGDAVTDQEAEPPGEEEPEEEPAAPEKPEYPRAPTVEPDKEALLLVLEGKRALRIEAQRSEEVRAAIALARDREIPRVVLEHASASGPLAEDLALQGVPVVLVDILPGTTPDTYGGGDSGALPSTLADSGVAIAIASGSVARARHLAIVAAYAAGRGLDPDTALRAITLTPAEILGVSREVGSLDAGKLADIVVLSAPIFASDAQVLRVLSAGTTQYEAR